MGADGGTDTPAYSEASGVAAGVGAMGEAPPVVSLTTWATVAPTRESPNMVDFMMKVE